MPDLAGEKTLYYGFTGPIDSAHATRIASALNAAANEQYEKVYIAFSSLGGYVADGVFLYNLIRSMPYTTVMHNTGSVASIATAVFVAADERLTSSYANFMIHPTSIQNPEGMTAERLQDSLNSALTEDSRTENILRERCSIPDHVLTQRRFKDVHITAEAALEYGLVTSVEEFVLPQGVQILQI